MTSIKTAVYLAGNKPRRETARHSRGFRLRGLLGVVVLLPPAILALFSQPALDETSPAALGLNAAGWLFFLFYLGWRLWATLYIGGRKDRELQTQGPYSLCRNPLYFGSFCYALSMACFLKSAVFAACVVMASLFYALLVVPAEEHSLGLMFGEDFKNYCQRTPRFWPRWSAFHTPPAVRIDLKWIRKESVRLFRAALLPIALQVVLQLRTNPHWPHWFHGF